MTQLRKAIEYHDYRYGGENDPIISDRAYDRLFDRLETLDEEFGLRDEHLPMCSCSSSSKPTPESSVGAVSVWSNINTRPAFTDRHSSVRPLVCFEGDDTGGR